MRKSRLSAVTAGVLLLSLSGCNKLRLAYEFADWMIIYTVNDNFDLDKNQYAQFKGDVATYFQWHRRTMLPRYADWLRRGNDSIQAGLTASAYDSAYAEFRALYLKTLEPVVERAQTLLSSLTSDQKKAYAGELKKKNQKIRKAYLRSREQKLEARYKKTLAAIEDWAGRLSVGQKKQVRVLSIALPWNGDLWLENREKMQAELIRLLEAKSSSPEILKAFLQDYFLHQEKFRSPAYQAGYHEYELGVRNLILGLNGLLTPKQKARLYKEVENQARELQILSRGES